MLTYALTEQGGRVPSGGKRGHGVRMPGSAADLLCSLDYLTVLLQVLVSSPVKLTYLHLPPSERHDGA